MMTGFRKTISATIISVATLTSISSAQAADKIGKSAPGLWQGFYTGVNIGGSINEDLERFDMDPDPIFQIEIDNDSKSFTGGGHIGFNFQKDNIVLGIEGDYSYLESETSFKQAATGLGVTIRQSMLASVRGRIGFAQEKALIYATGGAAWTTLEAKGETINGTLDESDTSRGYVFGGGLEYMISNNMILRAEGLHYVFGDEIDSGEVDFENTVIRAGLSWKFN